jgi:hypothetical protein
MCAISGLPLGRELNTSAPHSADGQRVGNVGQRIAVDQQQVGAGSGRDATSIGESEPTRGGDGGRSERLDGRQSSATNSRSSWCKLAPWARPPRLGSGSDTSVPANMSTPAACRARTLAKMSFRLPCG